MLITRDEFAKWLCRYIDIERLLDMVESNQNTKGFIIQYLNDTVVIWDTYTDFYVSWYKPTHIGRALRTNMNLVNLDSFIDDLLNDCPELKLKEE